MINDEQKKSYDLSNQLIITIEQDASFADVVFTGEIDRSILDRSFFELIKHPHFKFNINACYDYSKAYSGLDMSEIEEHAQFVAGHLNKRGQNYKLALVSNETFNNALLSVYKLLISKTSVEAELFPSRKLAVKWLNQN